MKAASGRKFFDSHYDVVIIGAGLGGLSAALKLSLENARVLLLEQHNLPGGFASSFVRGRFEFEVACHVLTDIGPRDNKGPVRKILEDEGGVDVEFSPVPEAYRLILTGSQLDITVPLGWGGLIDAIATEVPGSREPLTRYMELCQEVGRAIRFIGASKGPPDTGILMAKYKSFLATAGYTVEEVTRSFRIPDRALEILYPYWCYIGVPVNRMSFPIWAVMLDSYMSLGAYIPRLTSHGLTTALDKRIRELGAQTEYNTRVEKIFVEGGKVTGVRTDSGDMIGASHVIANVSPQLVYSKMIHPASEVPGAALQLTGARRVGTSAFVVYLGLDVPPEELNIDCYSYFIGESMDSRKIYQSFFTLEEPLLQATVCLNKAIPDCSPPGTTVLIMASLAGPDVWQEVRAVDYFETKNRLAGAMIR